MKKLTRRGFLRLASIWGVVPLLPKGLQVAEDEPKYKESNPEKPSPWDETISPYHFSPSVNSEYYWHRESVLENGWCTIPGCWCKDDPVWGWLPPLQPFWPADSGDDSE